MPKGLLSWDEILNYLHPIMPCPYEFEMQRIAFEFDSGRIPRADLLFRSRETGEKRHLLCHDVMPENLRHIELRPSYHSGVLIVDISHWQWQDYSVAVVTNQEETPPLFLARSVQLLR